MSILRYTSTEGECFNFQLGKDNVIAVHYLHGERGNTYIVCLPPQLKQQNYSSDHLERIRYCLSEGFIPKIVEDRVRWVPPKTNPQVESIREAHLPSSSALPPVLEAKKPIHEVLSRYHFIATTQEQRNACFHFLLQTQHGNADFTTQECGWLGYPIAPVAPQKYPGYFRCEFNRLFELITPWLDRYLAPFFKNYPIKSNPKNLIKPGSSLTLAALQALFSNTIQIHPDFDSLPNNNSSMKHFVLVPIKFEDLAKIPSKIFEERWGLDKLQQIKKAYPKLYFLFTFQIPGIDVVLFWGATWHFSKRPQNFSVKCISLEHADLFGNNAFSKLNQVGAVPDRMDVHRFLTHDPSQHKALPFFKNITQPPARLENYHAQLWNEEMCAAQRYVFNDVGSNLYRNAILKWQTCFFENYGLCDFAAPLLRSQVSPWISAEPNIVKWAKAYQNLCEIVMFCLEYSPEKFTDLDFEESALAQLDPHKQFQRIHKSAGLFSYGMSSIFEIFFNILKGVEGKQLSVACITQNYFETLDTIEKMSLQGSFTVQKENSLNAISKFPDILIADIHPNNAARNQLSENDIAPWVARQLVENPSKKMVLILDFTLNSLSDREVQKIFERLLPFIQEGQLEIFGIQSLAKLVQLGADNFSGGSYVYLAPLTREKPFTASPIPQKAAFFALLHLYFQDSMAAYLSLIRKNTDWMYQVLGEAFSNIAGEGASMVPSFCAVKRTLNTDEQTVYVAINFSPLLEHLKNLTKDEKEPIVSHIRLLILKLAASRNLPLTGRQSFGFALSNMSDVCESIRFSIGIENEKLLADYVQLISDVVLMLSSYAVKAEQFKIEDFESRAIEANSTLLSPKKTLFDAHFPVFEIDNDDYGEEINTKIGTAQIQYENGAFTLIISKKDQDSAIHSQINGAKKWSFSDKLKVIFHLICLPKSVEVQFNDQDLHEINGIFDEGFFSDAYAIKAIDERSETSVTLLPNLSVDFQGRNFQMNKVYICVEDLGVVNLGKLNREKIHIIFNQFLRNRFKGSLRGKDSVFIQLAGPKEFPNYLDTISDLYKKDGIAGVVDALNNCDFATLPSPEPTDGPPWYSQKTALETICTILEGLGIHVSLKLKESGAQQILQIKNKACKEAMIRGVYEGLLKGTSQKKAFPEEVAKTIAAGLFFPNLQIFDEYQLQNWIEEAKKALQSNQNDDTPWLKSYTIAFAPLIRKTFSTPSSLCDTAYSVALHQIAEHAKDAELIEYLLHLERGIPQAAKQLEKAKLLTAYLRLLLDYPLMEKTQNQLLQQLAKLPKKLIEEWIYPFNPLYSPLDHQVISLADPPSELILKKDDQKCLEPFFSEIGGKAILLEGDYGVDVLFRWAIMTQDQDLFLRLIEAFQRPNQELCAILDQFREFLDESDPIQKRLKDMNQLQ